jgi:hypothetical protein|tara:strand:+ start:1935 stop:2696 length:762 start_codon:yes stop_codon:yes gene_type:complete
MVTKEKILLIAGCSHTAGSEIDGNEDSEYNRKNSYGGLIATELNRRPIHIAQVGATNSGIARQVLQWFHKEYDPATMNVNVLIGWTEPTRLEIPSMSHRNYESATTNADWYDKSANDYYRIIIGWDGGDDEERSATPLLHKFMVEHQPFLEYQCYNLILQVQYLLQLHKIPYMMCNTMPFFLDNIDSVKNLIPLIDSNKYYQLGKKNEAFFPKYQLLGYVNEKAKYWHHGEEPHKLFAKDLLKFNKENKCLKK